jgi:DNA-binding FadR family transcriptional regulator
MELIARIPGDHGRIAKRTVKDQISDKLAYMIHSGLLRVGDELPSERELAGTLGVSRETVRAAMGVLQARKMIEVSQGSRTRVLGTGPYSLHESVSTLSNLKNNELARLAVLVHDQEAMLRDPVRFQISDREFHATLYQACGNALLVDVVSDFYDYALEFRRRALQRPGAIAHSVAEHRGIVEALKTRKPEAAVAAARKHLEQVRRTTLDEMSAP